MANSTRTLRTRVLFSIMGCALALGLALLSAHLYRAPALRGAPAEGVADSDTWCALASSAVAACVGLWPDGANRGHPFGRMLRSGFVWLFWTFALWLIWSPRVLLLTLPIAPTHALAAVRLFDRVRRLRAERSFLASR